VKRSFTKKLNSKYILKIGNNLFQKTEIELFPSNNLHQSDEDVHFDICEFMFERIKKPLEKSGFEDAASFPPNIQDVELK